MKNLLVYLKEYRKQTILAPLFKMLEATLELFVPLVVKAIIDVGIGNADKTYVIKMVGVLVLLGLIGLAFSITAQYFSARAAVGFVKKLRHVLFSHIQKLSYSELDTQGTSSLITRLTSDMNQVQNGVNLTLRLLLRSPFVVIGSMIMAFTVDAKAAMAFAIGIPVLAVVVFGIMFASIPLYRRVQNRLDDVLGMTRENLTGVRVLRAFCKEEDQVKEYREKNEILTDTQKFVGRISALLNPLTYVIVNAAIIALIYTGAIRVEAGIITQGAVVALYNYMAQILTELIKLANLIINITKSVACGNRIQAVLEVEPSVKDPEEAGVSAKASDVAEHPHSDMVIFEDAALCYPKASDTSVAGLSFAVPKGSTVGIIGGTGSGKTSLINLIPRFYDCSQGRVLVDGVDVREYELSALRDKIGVVPQKAVLFAGTIRENMQWGKKDATDEEIYEALTIAQALEVVSGKEGGLDCQVEQGGRNFSGGQRQRLTIARALVKKPDILILDDSSSALDFATDAALRKAIATMKDKPTTFIVSQRTSAIQQADQIIVLDDGQIVGHGQHKDLLEHCQVYRETHFASVSRAGQNEHLGTGLGAHSDEMEVALP